MGNPPPGRPPGRARARDVRGGNAPSAQTGSRSRGAPAASRRGLSRCGAAPASPTVIPSVPSPVSVWSVRALARPRRDDPPAKGAPRRAAAAADNPPASFVSGCPRPGASLPRTAAIDASAAAHEPWTALVSELSSGPGASVASGAPLSFPSPSPSTPSRGRASGAKVSGEPAEGTSGRSPGSVVKRQGEPAVPRGHTASLPQPATPASPNSATRRSERSVAAVAGPRRTVRGRASRDGSVATCVRTGSNRHPGSRRARRARDEAASRSGTLRNAGRAVNGALVAGPSGPEARSGRRGSAVEARRPRARASKGGAPQAAQ